MLEAQVVAVALIVGGACAFLVFKLGLVPRRWRGRPESVTVVRVSEIRRRPPKRR